MTGQSPERGYPDVSSDAAQYLPDLSVDAPKLPPHKVESGPNGYYAVITITDLDQLEAYKASNFNKPELGMPVIMRMGLSEEARAIARKTAEAQLAAEVLKRGLPESTTSQEMRAVFDREHLEFNLSQDAAMRKRLEALKELEDD